MSASLRSELPDGGIRGQHVENDFQDLVTGRPTKQRIAIVVLEPNGVSLDKNQAGRVNKVKYLAVHLAEIRDAHEADQLRHRITQIRASQGLETSQPTLFALSDAEQSEALIDLIKDWASAKDIAIADLDKQWWSYFGGDDADGLSKTIQACRSPLQLKEFAYEIGAIKDTKPVEDPEPVDEDSDEDEPDTDGGAELDVDETDGPTALRSVPFTEVAEQ